MTRWELLTLFVGWRGGLRQVVVASLGMAMHRMIVSTAIVASLASGYAAGGGSQQALSPQEFLRRIRPSWDDYLMRAKPFQGTVTQEIRELGNDNKRLSWGRSETTHRPGCVMHVGSAIENGDETSHTVASNPDYTFGLTRRSRTGPWVLTRYEKTATDTTSPTTSPGDPQDVIDQILFAPLTILTPPERLPDLLEYPDFKVVNVAEAVVDGETRLRMDFVNTPKDIRKSTINGKVRRGGAITLETGYILLDPARHYLIRAYKVRSRSTRTSVATVTARYEYANVAEGLPLLSKIVREYTEREPPKSGDVQSIDEYNFSTETPPESAFRLQAFGIPEPGSGDVARRIPIYLWAIGAGIICLVASLLLRFRSRRRQDVSVP